MPEGNLPNGSGAQPRRHERHSESGATRRSFLRTTAGVGALVAGGGAGGIFGTAAAIDGDLPTLHRKENLIVDPSDNRLTLRGVNTIDAGRAGGVEDYVQAATSGGWHSKIIRVPMQPGDIGNTGSGPAPASAFSLRQLEDYVTSYIDSAVDAAEQAGAYIILDYHRHWPDGPDWNNPDLGDEIDMFWNYVAERYSTRDHVIYEVFNEPTTPNSGDPASSSGEQTWLSWREQAQPWVDTIRENAPENLVLIGSPRWSQFTAQAPGNEFEGDNLAYVGHTYTQSGVRPLSEYFGAPSEEVPVFMTEFGWSPQGQDHWIGTNEDEGQNFWDFYDDYPHISWMAWCFDTNWGPNMLNSYFSANDYGQFVKDRLAAKRDRWRVADYEGKEPEGPPAIDGVAPQDVDGDGQYQDFNANGDVDFDDVVTYFDNMDEPAMTDHVGAYDYNGNSEVDFADVVSLFEAV